MAVKVLDSTGQSIQLNDSQTELLYSSMNGPSDARISSCMECRSAVVATEPFNNVLDEMSNNYPGETDLISALIEFVENSESVHLYLLEDNDCVHLLWRDPLASEWSAVTGEKRLHH